MPMFLSNFGIDFFKEDEETFNGLLAYLTQNGKAIDGYYGQPSLFNKQGDIDMYVKTVEEDGKLVIAGLDTHCTGPHVWTMAATGFNLMPKDALPTERLVAFQRAKDHGGLVPIHLINADVLPSFRDGDIIKMQMTAFPIDIRYYATEEEYIADQPTGKDGKKWMTATGTFFPVQMLHNHRVEKPEDEDVDYSTDDIVTFTAKVKQVYHGDFTFGEDTGHSFIRCYAETENGDIIFAHTVDQVKEGFRDNIKEGAIISGLCILSGDVAIYEYENGIVKSAENALRVVRQALETGEADRLRPVLTATSVYDSKFVEEKPIGADAIIGKLKAIHGAIEKTVYAHPATITRLDSDELEYGLGTRCLILCYGDAESYNSLMFVDVDEEGNITRIRVDDDSRYHFHLDHKDYEEEFDEEECKKYNRTEECNELRHKYLKLIKEAYETYDFSKIFEHLYSKCQWSGKTGRNVVIADLIESAKSMKERNYWHKCTIVQVGDGLKPLECNTAPDGTGKRVGVALWYHDGELCMVDESPKQTLFFRLELTPNGKIKSYYATLPAGDYRPIE